MTQYFSIRLPDDEIRAISSIGLAHLGDAVYELLVRTYLCAHGKAAEKILAMLTEEEQAVFRRGRNANVHSIPPNASRAQYQQATALEALMGWLYLRGEKARIEELFAVMMGE